MERTLSLIQIFGINLIFTPDPDKDAFTGRMIELMAKEKVAAAVIYAAKPISRWFNKLHDNGIKIIYRPATPTKEIVEAVSYTHLDVYKRQAISCSPKQDAN